MKRFSGMILALAVMVVAGLALAAPAQRCVSFNLTDNDNTDSPVLQVRPASAPWVAWLGTVHGSAATVVVKGYGPCLDNRSAALCARGLPFTLATLSGSTTSAGGVGPVEAVQFSATTPCGTPTCIGGANENGACSTASACPGSTCGPCKTVPSFCGVNSSGQE